MALPDSINTEYHTAPWRVGRLPQQGQLTEHLSPLACGESTSTGLSLLYSFIKHENQQGSEDDESKALTGNQVMTCEFM